MEQISKTAPRGRLWIAPVSGVVRADSTWAWFATMNRQMLTDLEAAAGEGATEAKAWEVEGRSEVTEAWKREMAWLEMSKAVRGKPARRRVMDMA